MSALAPRILIAIDPSYAINMKLKSPRSPVASVIRGVVAKSAFTYSDKRGRWTSCKSLRTVRTITIQLIVLQILSFRHHQRQPIAPSGCFRRDTNMSVPLRVRKSDENQVFMRNVPQHMARTTIPRLFSEFNPTSEKIIYPQSRYTTMVFRFRNKDDAQRAREANNNRRLGGVVLSVELYQERKSVQPLRETAARAQSRPVGFLDSDFDPQDWGGKATDKASLVNDVDLEELRPSEDLALPQLPYPEPRSSTWASIVANAQAGPPATAPGLSRGRGRDTPMTIDDTPAVTPHIDPSVPNLKPVADILTETQGETTIELSYEAQPQPGIVPDAPEAEMTSVQDAASTPGHLPLSVSLPCSDVSHDFSKETVMKENDEKQAGKVTGASHIHNTDVLVATEPNSSYTPRPYIGWNYVDSSERIRQKYECICSFCQARNRLPKH
ncbi:hypothetical protein T440DRAFT_469340 [Plenodomus tracheiphilus IPT5]|uniref:RRM domain-containing protein n=1 Tax=Plenodomus tracheiphilus IPT5 TaxID=1408161 RepID=A0A6A7B571_9PLEO|nr:hypothetical protein T440DRAFT_469340 [Plenodomus tracheiphilus IPT5]